MDASVYTRPNKPERLVVKQRGQVTVPVVPTVLPALRLDRDSDCFVTPPDVAARMVAYLDALPNMRILEPSVGTGNLVDALLRSDHPRGNITVVEQNSMLLEVMQSRFGNRPQVIHQCFIEYAEQAASTMVFSRIVMNPPFSKGNTRKHIDAALSLLDDDGVLVALVPSSYTHPEAFVLEDLPAGTFESTQVRTKIIRIALAND